MKASKIVLVSAGTIALGLYLTRGPARVSLAQVKATSPSGKVTVAYPASLPVAPGDDLPDDDAPASLPSSDPDPEKTAREFLDKNQKIADKQVAALRKEAEALRSRLQKVNSAISRWEALAQALKPGEHVVTSVEGSLSGQSLPDNPTDLSPILPPVANDIDLPNPNVAELQPIPKTRRLEPKPPVAPFLPPVSSFSDGPKSAPVPKPPAAHEAITLPPPVLPSPTDLSPAEAPAKPKS